MLKKLLTTLTLFALPACPSGTSGPSGASDPSRTSVAKNDATAAETTVPERCKGLIAFGKLCYDKSDALNSCDESRQIIDSSVTVEVDDPNVRAAIYNSCRVVCRWRKEGKPWSEMHAMLREACDSSN